MGRRKELTIKWCAQAIYNGRVLNFNKRFHNY